MKIRLFVLTCLSVLTLLGLTAAALKQTNPDLDQREVGDTLIDVVRQATEPYKDIEAAEAAGYGLFHGCVSGPQEGAMGVHYVNGALVGDGVLDASQPEALLYEFKGALIQLVGVEYVVIADDWHANNDAPPMLMGQLFNYVPSPNRYGIPAFYELHVWAWRRNSLGTFADWNPKVTCEEYTDGEKDLTLHH
jgi:hypothetical protein